MQQNISRRQVSNSQAHTRIRGTKIITDADEKETKGNESWMREDKMKRDESGEAEVDRDA